LATKTLRRTSPLDEYTIVEYVEESGRLIMVDSPPHVPLPFAPELEDAFIPSPEKIADAVRKARNYS
jgi:acetoin:2,6-dichlorophenolindophenol oxidoreductase subunit beta